MSSLTRVGYEDIYKNAKNIFARSTSPIIRRQAKEIAVLIEKCVGQMDRQPAETWKV